MALATPICAAYLNHLETQYAEAQSHFSDTYIPLAGTETLLGGNPAFPTAAVGTTTLQVATCGFVHSHTRIIVASASNTVRFADTAEESNYTLTPTEIKSCMIPDTYTTGTYRITWDARSKGAWEANCRIYVDGVAAGTAHTLPNDALWYSFSTDITIADAGGVSTNSTGKTIQVYLWSDGSAGASVRNFYVKCSHSLLAGY